MNSDAIDQLWKRDGRMTDASSNSLNGAEAMVRMLQAHGVKHVFGLCGDTSLPFYDALYRLDHGIEHILTRDERSAAYMADAYAKLTGRPGICFVTRGPGATNASVGIHTARQDSSPVILFIGQVARGTTEREGFQEIDYRRMYGQMSKWVAQIDDPSRIPEMVSRAFHMAVSGRPGPVVLALPEDMQIERAAAPEVGCYREIQASPAEADMRAIREALASAERPLMIVGGSTWTEHACADITAFAEANAIPVAAAYRRQDLIDNRHRSYVGVLTLGTNAALVKTVQESDLLLVVGPQLGEIITNGYTLITPPRSRQKLIHVSAGIEELGKVYQADLPINAGMAPFAAARALDPVDSSAWSDWAGEARAAYEAYLKPQPAPGDVDFGAVMHWLDEVLPDNAIITNGAGNFTVWVHRFFRYRRYRTQLAPQSGSMGYGVPAGVAAGIVHRDRPVVAFAGDGDFLMNGQEIATAAQYGLDVVFIVVNNGMYGTIRMHQERQYPGRISATQLINPDFAAYARSFGCHGEVVERTADFAAAFERARAATGPALIELRVDPEAITPTTTLGALRGAAEKR